MAGAPWLFTLLPDSINTVTITDGNTTVTVNRGSEGDKYGDDTFFTGAFVETMIVTISATGYNDLTNITVGDTNLVMTPIQTKPEHLYAYTDPNPSSETLYAWTTSSAYTPTTFYTKTSTPSSTETVYDANGNSLGPINDLFWTGEIAGWTSQSLSIIFSSSG